MITIKPTSRRNYVSVMYRDNGDEVLTFRNLTGTLFKLVFLGDRENFCINGRICVRVFGEYDDGFCDPGARRAWELYTGMTPTMTRRIWDKHFREAV